MADNTLYYVVLDANVLIRDFWMSGPSFSYLLTHQFLSHQPIIPEVAYLEARNHLKRRAEMLLANRSSQKEGSHGNTQRLIRLFNYKRVPPKVQWDVDKLLTRWDKHVKRVLRRWGGRILPSPDVDLGEIVQRSIERKKPFSRGDSGFRDTLIWLSTLTLVGPESRVSFVTENTQDFFTEGSAEPHPDILREVERKLDGNWKMLFHRSIDEFISSFDSDRRTSADALRRALIANQLKGFDLWEWLEDNITSIVGEDEFDAVGWAGLPSQAEAPTLLEVEGLISLDVPRVDHLRGDVYRLYCDFAFVGEFSCDIGFAKAEDVVHPNQITWKDESDPFWTTIGLRAVATFIMLFDFDVSANTVISHFARPLEHWTTYGQAIEDLEAAYLEIQALDLEWQAESEEEPSSTARDVVENS